MSELRCDVDLSPQRTRDCLSLLQSPRTGTARVPVVWEEIYLLCRRRNRTTRGDVEASLPFSSCSSHRSRHNRAPKSVRAIACRLQCRADRYSRRNADVGEGSRLSECDVGWGGLSRSRSCTTGLSLRRTNLSVDYTSRGTCGSR